MSYARKPVRKMRVPPVPEKKSKPETPKKMKTTQKPTKLQYDNQWEYDIYRVGKEVITRLEEVKIGTQTYKVTGRDVSVPYNDMGHRYTANSTHYFITEKVFGMKKKFDLNTIVGKKVVYATKFTSEKDPRE